MNDWQKLTTMRYKCIPSHYKIHIGGIEGLKHAYSPSEIIEEIQRNTKVGKLFVEVEKQYLQSIKYEYGEHSVSG